MVKPTSAAGRTTLTHAVAGLLAAAATWLVGHAVAPAQAQQPHQGGWVTTAQLEELRADVQGYRGEVLQSLRMNRELLDRLRQLEITQAEQRGAAQATKKAR